jgi:choline/glycine/proline betaine transport protein
MFFLIYLAFSKFGKIKLGGAEAKPDFSRISWFSMLFSAGLGIGLLFYGVAEPIYHFNDNPFVDNTDAIAAAKSAMGITFYHYGIQAWSIYATVGLALAFSRSISNFPSPFVVFSIRCSGIKFTDAGET